MENYRLTRAQILMLVVLALVLIAVVVGIALVTRPNGDTTLTASLPTLIVLPTLTTTTTPSITPSLTATPSATPSAIPSATVPPASFTPSPTVGTPLEFQAAELTITAAVGQFTSTPTPTLEPTRPVLTDPLILPPPGTLEGDTAIGENTGGGESGSGLNIGSGDLYVIDYTRPAETRIAELGGSVSPAPAGQTWVLLELLLICTGSDNCAPDSVTLVGSSGATYTPTTVEVLPPFTAAAFSAGQVYGYAGFLVAETEASLGLAAMRGGQVYTLALR